jgi:hypothetical protein
MRNPVLVEKDLIDDQDSWKKLIEDYMKQTVAPGTIP